MKSSAMMGMLEIVEFLAHGRAIVVVPPEGNAVASRGIFTDEGRGPANQPESPGAWPAEQLNRSKQKGSDEYEDVGTEEDGVQK